MNASAMETDPGAAPKWRAFAWLTLAATWTLIFVGALTRASQAGISCPDWPLCHGYLVPPTVDSAYPPAPMYTAYKVYLEFSHRVLAALVSTGAVIVGLGAWRARARGLAVALGLVLAAQILMGAVTVWLQNAPYTVVIHLALALGFVTVLLAILGGVFIPARPPSGAQRPTGEVLLGALVVAQMLVGAQVSSAGFGLACHQFPLCLGDELLPPQWSAPFAWQLGHRALGIALLLASLGWAFARLRSGVRGGRGHAVVFAALLSAQVLLGAANVWLRIPPWASAAHMGLAVVLYGWLIAPVAGRVGLSLRAATVGPILAAAPRSVGGG